MSKVFTFGCRLNFWESNKINQLLSTLDKKNLTVFNTCSVTNEAVKNTISSIKKFNIRNPKVKIIVTGCAVETNFETFNNMKEVSFVVKNSQKLEEATWKILPLEEKSENLHVKDCENLKKVNPSNSNVRKFVRIQNGCDHSCTFCIIPKCRGKSVSDSIENINNDISFNLKKNIKEIILTGVDLTSWGSELKKKLYLGDLIKEIFSRNNDYFRLRLSSLDVAELDDTFFEVLKNDKRLMPHFHFSLQSLNNMILKRMKRRHSVEQVKLLFTKIRSMSSDVTFGADIITGFPTETEKMFLETKRLIKELDISHLHVFPYSEKDGTPAARMPQLPIEVRRSRAKELRRVGEELHYKLLEKQILNKHKVLVENIRGEGRTENNFRVKLENNLKVSRGSIVEVIPSKIKSNYLIGKI